MSPAKLLGNPAVSDDDHQATTRRVAGLIVVGVIDIGVMVCCLSNGKGYASSLNIFVKPQRNLRVRVHLFEVVESGAVLKELAVTERAVTG